MFIYSPTVLAAMAHTQRKKLGLTQSDVAQRARLKQKTISGFENRPEGTKLETVIRILNALELECLVQQKGYEGDATQLWKEAW